jgi:D-3-phosphoglycerate dehydrogenase
MGRQLSGATLGVIGYGAIGRELTRAALALGMRVVVADPHARVDAREARQVPMAEVLAAADFVVCLAAATPETENLMDATAFAAMKPGAAFINLSRGELVDEAALAAALDSGRLAGAALDVGRAPGQEPSPALAARGDVIATPHVGGLTPNSTRAQAMQTVAQARAVLAGEVPPNALNAGAASRLSRMRPGGRDAGAR